MEAQEFFQSGFCPQFPPSDNNNNNAPPASLDHFIVEDFFDFSNDDAAPVVADNTATFDSLAGNSTDSSSAATALDSTHSSSSQPNFLPADAHFSSDLPVPCDDIAELEWLSNFAEESFSTEDLQKMQLITGMKARNDAAQEARQFQPEPNPVLSPQVSVPAKARSKRSRGPPCNWTSRLLVLSPPPTAASSSSSQAEVGAPKKAAPRRREGGEGSDGRKCLHCATDKTPQWRTGPMGPKTLCNACGVRYKSGRLVPEYRPAASPTFVLTKHSNSHRKVMELRRQKEMMRAQQHHHQQLLHHHHHHHHHHQAMMFDVSSNGDDYLIHQHVGPDFAQLI